MLHVANRCFFASEALSLLAGEKDGFVRMIDDNIDAYITDPEWPEWYITFEDISSGNLPHLYEFAMSLNVPTSLPAWPWSLG